MATRLERPQTWQKTLPIFIWLTDTTIATNSVTETVVSAVLALALEETDLPFHEAVRTENAMSATNHSAGQTKHTQEVRGESRKRIFNRAWQYMTDIFDEEDDYENPGH
jgi:hypothetical protein